MDKKVNVGGQAVLEGVMMRSPVSLAVAVRRPNKEIVVKEAIWHSIWDKYKFLKWPFFRGTVVMIEAMMNGMQALNFSASEAMPEDENAKDSGGEMSWVQMVFPMLLSIVFAIALFKFLPHMVATYSGKFLTGTDWTVDDIYYHMVDGLVKVVLFIGYIALIGLLKDIRRVFMYHGAEHMAIYTYEDGEELTVENARKKSRLHPRCGTSFLMVVILIFMVVSAIVLPFLPDVLKPGENKPFYTHLLLVLAKLPLLIPVAGIAYEFNRYAGKHLSSPLIKPLIWPGMFMQLLTTKQPTDDQLEISLTSLRTSLWRESVGKEIADDDEPLVFKDFSDFCEKSENLRPV
ncbi:MAG: DUF1385 domain-containing protein [Deltaproteobacteria bacterium]|nr:DUF1385 domain-containing protein [Deltaproteobacteria bacterium]